MFKDPDNYLGAGRAPNTERDTTNRTFNNVACESQSKTPRERGEMMAGLSKKAGTVRRSAHVTEKRFLEVRREEKCFDGKHCDS